MATEKHWVPNPKLTRKQNAFVQHLVTNPKASGTAAASAAYGKPHKPISYDTARSMAAENLAKPSIMLELSKYSGTAEITMLDVMEYSKEYGREGDKAGAAYAAVAISAAKDVLDRIHGKAVQRVQATSTAVNLNINLG